ncbi:MULTISPECIES: hypothetical protein [unclassified Romboutsia]|uniref:hypothetical protein n=1 Tax=unclassified Romboutsia TaxID=2626894 RepID=UPI000820FF47|nr:MULTISPECIES: hypothetical protein [unclassified Romboutsia]SCH85720.1 Uncharacterised protein [uncultured Clostridium sp.]
MNNKLTYKIKEVLTKNEYTDIIIKHKLEDTELKLSDSKVRFRYEPKEDKAYLSFGNENQYTVCEVEDGNINEIIINDELLVIEADEKYYHCYLNKDKIY